MLCNSLTLFARKETRIGSRTCGTSIEVTMVPALCEIGSATDPPGRQKPLSERISVPSLTGWGALAVEARSCILRASSGIWWRGLHAPPSVKTSVSSPTCGVHEGSSTATFDTLRAVLTSVQTSFAPSAWSALSGDACTRAVLTLRSARECGVSCGAGLQTPLSESISVPTSFSSPAWAVPTCDARACAGSRRPPSRTTCVTSVAKSSSGFLFVFMYPDFSSSQAPASAPRRTGGCPASAAPFRTLLSDNFFASRFSPESEP
mmetsp:Transcript_52389/g.132422  ORF Transcript_52389/g.132422 Transcript_52389/m.132422 type:complete len:262 (-) Transcript_52389:1186-1971(-)